eukprot:5170500-Pyramimonas_sp.AAC.1
MRARNRTDSTVPLATSIDRALSPHQRALPPLLRKLLAGLRDLRPHQVVLNDAIELRSPRAVIGRG